MSAAVILAASSTVSLGSAVPAEGVSGHVAALSATLKDASLSTQEIAELTDQVNKQVEHPVVKKLLIARLEETTALRGPDGRIGAHSKSHSRSHSRTAVRRIV